MEKQFVAAGLDSFWAYQAHYGDAAEKAAASPGVSDPNRKRMIDYKGTLAAADFAFYLKLKDFLCWRQAGPRLIVLRTERTQGGGAPVAPSRRWSPRSLIPSRWLKNLCVPKLHTADLSRAAENFHIIPFFPLALSP